MRGDRVSFQAPVLGQMSCFVNDVQPLAGRARGGYLNGGDDPDGESSDRNQNR